MADEERALHGGAAQGGRRQRGLLRKDLEQGQLLTREQVAFGGAVLPGSALFMDKKVFAILLVGDHVS